MLSPIDIDPRVAVKRMPMSAAASMLSSSRAPFGNRYRWSDEQVQPDSASSANPSRAEARMSPGVIRDQIG